jgi:D-3-phosphoglycerate dehydrogenase
MHVIGFDPEITVEGAWRLSSNVQKAGSIEEMLGKVDFITFHVPLVDATRNMINAERLKLMKSRAVILNFARKGIIDDEAVSAALKAGKLYAYVCDFPTNLLKSHARVITLPHLGASTQEAEENCAVMVAEQVRDYLEHGTVRNAVNFPEIYMERTQGQRIAIVNRNEPNMLGQISSAIAKHNLNIIDMLNRSRGNLAYTLIDVEGRVDQALRQELGAIKGVLKIRTID